MLTSGLQHVFERLQDRKRTGRLSARGQYLLAELEQLNSDPQVQRALTTIVPALPPLPVGVVDECEVCGCNTGTC